MDYQEHYRIVKRFDIGDIGDGLSKVLMDYQKIPKARGQWIERRRNIKSLEFEPNNNFSFFFCKIFFFHFQT